MSWANDSCCHFSEGTISSRSTEDSSWHFISKCSFRHRHNNASPHYHWMTNVCKMCFGLSLQLKYMHSFPFLHLHWLRGRADVPWSHPHGTLTPSCHSNDNSFSYHHDSCCTPDRLAGPGQPHHSLAQPPIHLYLYCQFCKFHFPIISTPPPPLLFLQAPHYPLSAFFTHSPISHCLFNVISFFLLPRHLLPIANFNFFFFVWPVKPCTVCPVQMCFVGQNLRVMDWLKSLCVVHIFTISAECCSTNARQEQEIWDLTLSSLFLHPFLFYHFCSWFYRLKRWSQEHVKGRV